MAGRAGDTGIPRDSCIAGRFRPVAAAAVPDAQRSRALRAGALAEGQGRSWRHQPQHVVDMLRRTTSLLVVRRRLQMSRRGAYGVPSSVRYEPDIKDVASVPEALSSSGTEGACGRVTS
jgi:hypothetical protein